MSTTAWKEKAASLQMENLRYRDLIGVLRSRTEPEAFAILQRIRATDNPLLVLDVVREAEKILPSPRFSGEPSTDELVEIDREA
jgi:hypothetical protein